MLTSLVLWQGGRKGGRDWDRDSFRGRRDDRDSFRGRGRDSRREIENDRYVPSEIVI